MDKQHTGDLSGGRRKHCGGNTAARWMAAVYASWLGAMIGLLSLVPLGAMAAPIPFSAQSLSYDLQEETLPGFLQRLFGDENIEVQLSPGVRNQTGTLNGPRRGTAGEIFQSVADSYRLGAYYDGASVHVFRRDEVVSRYFSIRADQAGALQSAVRQLGANEYNTTKVNGSSGLVTVSGTQDYVDQVVQIGQALGQQPQQRVQAGNTVFRFFALKYAWASDRSFVVSNRQVVIPGVATVLQQLLDEGGAYAGVGNFQGPNESILPATAPSLNGQGLAALGNNLRNDAAGRNFVTDGRGGLRMVPGGAPVAQAPQMMAFSTGGSARIVADPYRNAVIVRDVPERIALYEDLIRALDVETSIMEIAATIIDVDTDKLRRLGVEWRYGSRRFESVNGVEGSKDDFVNSILTGNIAALGQVPGFQLGAIIGNKDQFIARVNAFQQDGAMRVVSRPQVVTINDIEATIESSRQLYVPVNGAFQVDLFNVYAGTVLRVTPHLINDNARERIRMLVTVEDGDLRLSPSESGADIPEVVRNAVSTQAVIDAGQSLLLGGLVRDSSNTTVTKVPILGDIPLLGELFKTRQRDSGHTERMFLISPRLLDDRRPQIMPTAMPELDSRTGSPDPSQMPYPPKLPALPPPDWPRPPDPPAGGQVLTIPPPQPVQQPLQPTSQPVAAAPTPQPSVRAPASSQVAIAAPPAVAPPAPALPPEPVPAAASMPSAATTSEAQTQYRVNAPKGLKMRFDASTDTSVVGFLNQGATAAGTGRNRADASGREWSEVVAQTRSGETVAGWVASEFLVPQTGVPDDAQGVRP